jgi:N-acetylmuramoyl-L-alanine amidase
VIDPGHGGHDPGAQANALSEAELVLDVSLRLAALLEAQPGFEVVLTRRTDTFVPLEERTAIANREGADLFLSIHANSSPNAETRGIETFFLNFAESASAEAVAARENASSAQAMHLLPDLVKTIATNDKVAESRELASMVHESLMKRIGSLSKTIKDLGVKQAPFVVLIGAEMPSVLAEISFLTNRTEAGLLRQAAHRQRVAQALCDAILRYQASLKTPPTIATRSEER